MVESIADNQMCGGQSELKKCEEGSDEQLVFVSVRDILESIVGKQFENY